MTCGKDRSAWLTSARDAAGIATDAELARKAEALTPSGRSLIAGFRASPGAPSWRHVPGLAKALAISVDDVLVHLWGERPGDPCPCGCGGVKVAPDTATARKLQVERACGDCGAIHRYRKQGEQHFPLCRTCSQKGIIHFGAVPSAGAKHPATPVIRAALERQDVTLQEAERLAGYAPGTVTRWLSGRRGSRGVYRETLGRLVSVLEAPELLDVIPWRWRYWSLTCTTCGQDRRYSPDLFRAGRSRGFHQETVVDEAAGTGTYVCRRCKQSTAGKRSPVGTAISLLRKKKGKQGLRDKALTMLESQTPEQRREALEKAHAARRGQAMSDEQRQRIAVGLIKARPKGKWGYCRICEEILFSTRRGGTQAHGVCENDYRRQHQQAFGPPPEGLSRGVKQLSPEELADTFEMLVLHDLPTRRREKQSIAALATRFRLSRQGMLERWKNFMGRLPRDGRGGEQLTRWAAALRDAGAGSE